MKKVKQMPKPVLKIDKTHGSGKLVTYPVSYVYNGSFEWEGDWYQGFEVPKPDVPKGYELVNIGVGLQHNCMPPFATMLLTKIKKEVKNG
jgi:hypothetical protein